MPFASANVSRRVLSSLGSFSVQQVLNGCEAFLLPLPSSRLPLLLPLSVLTYSFTSLEVYPILLLLGLAFGHGGGERLISSDGGTNRI